MHRSKLSMAWLVGFTLALVGCGPQEGEEAETAQEQASVSCTPSNYTWRYFRTNSGAACVYGAFDTTCANQISVNIAEYPSWNAGSYTRIQGSGYRPSTATTGRVCAYACLSGPSTSKYYKTDLWDLGGRKKYQDWVTGNAIPDPEKFTTSWPLYTSTVYPSGCTLSPPIPN
jgi:hypothetical protein